MLGFDEAAKRFGAVTALDRCTFAARLTGFLGPNGAGKATAIGAVSGLVELDAGTARWQGESVLETGARVPDLSDGRRADRCDGSTA
jgi:ABC-2 type transport system ATP-binding protein